MQSFPLKIKDVFNKEGNFLIDKDGNNIGEKLLIQILPVPPKLANNHI